MDQNITNESPKTIKKRGFFKSFVDVRSWVSYDEIKANTKSTYGLFKRFFTKKSAKIICLENFDEAMLRLKLTEKQIHDRKKIFLYSALIYLFIGLILIAYAAYLVKKLYILPAMFTLMLAIFVLALTYREHLWYMQMCKKRLGCNFAEWLEFVFGKNSN